MSAVRREYRSRIATRGATEVEGNVEFILYLGSEAAPVLGIGRLGSPPSVTGTLVHPLQGRTTLRPFTVEGVDVGGALTAAFANDGRWTMLGRLQDTQYRTLPSGEWVTYGTGRVSLLDEAEGAGKFRLQVADESWVARKGIDVFGMGGTTQFYPSGPRALWSLHPPATSASCWLMAQQGSLYRISMRAGGITFIPGPQPDAGRGRFITPRHLEFARQDLLPVDERQFVLAPPHGNFRFLRLNYPAFGLTTPLNWEIVSFGDDPLDPDQVLRNLEMHVNDPENPALSSTDGGIGGLPIIPIRVLNVWIRWPGIPAAIPDGAVGVSQERHPGFLWAPDAPPSRLNPMHLGVALGDDHYWGSEITVGGGYLHVAEVTRRYFEGTSQRYDVANIAAVMADRSYPVVAERLTEIPSDPERWMEDHIWGPRQLYAGRNGRGERKLIDLRAPPDDADLSGFPVVDVSNSRNHRWWLDHREMTNAVRFSYPRIEWPTWDSRNEADATDGFVITEQIHPAPDSEDESMFDSDNIDFVNRRQKTFPANATMDPGLLPNVWIGLVGTRFLESALSVARFILSVYQDGPHKGACEIGRSLAETLEEGDYILLDYESLQGANPSVPGRMGLLLGIALSLTRHAAHADLEYMVVRSADPIPEFEACPDLGS